MSLMSIHLQTSASIQPRTSPVKFITPSHAPRSPLSTAPRTSPPRSAAGCRSRSWGGCPRRASCPSWAVRFYNYDLRVEGRGGHFSSNLPTYLILQGCRKHTFFEECRKHAFVMAPDLIGINYPLTQSEEKETPLRCHRDASFGRPPHFSRYGYGSPEIQMWSCNFLDS